MDAIDHQIIMKIKEEKVYNKNISRIGFIIISSKDARNNREIGFGRTIRPIKNQKINREMNICKIVILSIQNSYT